MNGRVGGLLYPGLLVAATIAAYANSWNVPFVFDDLDAIVDNSRIHTLWPPGAPITPDRGDITLAGRPVATFTFALNYAISGLDVWSYHAVNIAVHVFAALLLYGVVRRTLVRLSDPASGLRPASRMTAENAAFFVALLWAIHPLQTESVTYIVQRVESLAGMLMLATLYSILRGVDSRRPGVRYGLGIVCCGLAMGVKETAAVTPVIVLLYDRTFLAKTFREALRRRWPVYLGLSATWGVVAALAIGGARTQMASQAAAAFGRLEYLRIQCWAVVRYLRLAVWPSGLTFDYGGPLFGSRIAETWHEVIPQAVLLLVLLVMAVIALWRWPRMGFLAVVFFLLLSPSSSVVPVPLEPVAEHRMYLPLATIAVGFVLVVERIMALLTPTARRPGLVVFAFSMTACVLGGLTVLRNNDYRDDCTLWRDTCEKRPDNARAHMSLGFALIGRDDLSGAISAMRRAIAIKPDYGHAYANLGVVLHRAGRYDEAAQAWRSAIDVEPRMMPAYVGLAELYLGATRTEDAVEICRSALRVDDGYQEARLVLIRALLKRGDVDEAIREADRAVRDDPGDARACNLFGRALLAVGRTDDAVAQFRRALELRPDFPAAMENLRSAEAMGRR